LGDELLKREAFYTPLGARVIIEAWRRHYNTTRPRSALGCHARKYLESEGQSWSSAYDVARALKSSARDAWQG
jgi:hypothetical protein